MNNSQVLCKHCDQPILSRKDLTLASINVTPHPFHKLCYLEAKEKGDMKTNLALGPPINSKVMREPYKKTIVRMCTVMLGVLAVLLLLAFTLGGVQFSVGSLLGLSGALLFIFLVVGVPIGLIGYFFQKRIWDAIDNIESRLLEEQ